MSEEDNSSPQQGTEINIFHLITDEDELPEDLFQQWIKRNDMGEEGMDYGIVAVLGCQSSGKSTLLNILFETNFQTMEAQFGRSQTTKGIWMGRSKHSKLLVMDVEGTDGRERGEDTNFERKSSLFSLAISQILIINMWMHDVGRWQSANYPLLRTVFELNLRLFQKVRKSKVKLLFIIRDHVHTPLESLSQTIMQDLDKIWSQIEKPESHDDTQVSNFFEVDFAALPAKPHLPEEFQKEAEKLGVRFNDKTCDDTLWPSNEPDVPMDGLPKYCSQVWETIQSNKDLDIPSQLEMLAVVRCDELHNESVNIFKQETQKIEDNLRVHQEIEPKFGPQISVVMNKCLAHYDEQASRYQKNVSLQKRDLLCDKLNEIGLSLYSTQLELLREKALEAQKVELENALPPDPTPCENFLEVVGKSTDQVIASFVEEAHESDLTEGLSSPAHWNPERDVQILRKRINEVVEVKKKEHLVRVENDCANQIKEILRTISKHLETPDETMWKRVSESLVAGQEKYFLKLGQLLKESFGCGEEESEKFQHRLEGKVKESVMNMLKSKSSMIHYHMERTFEVDFRHDDDGLPRRWTPADDVTKMFKEAVGKAGQVLDRLAIIRLQNQDTTIFSPDCDRVHSEEEFLLTPDEAKDLFRKFKREVEADFSSATKEQDAVANKNQLPILWIAVLCLFAFDEIMWVLKNPFMILLLVLIGVICFLMYQFNLTPIVMPVVMDAYKQLMGRVGLMMAQVSGTPVPQQKRERKKEKKEEKREEEKEKHE